LKVFRLAKTVCCYVSLPDEVQTGPLIMRMLEAGKRVVVPKVQGRRLALFEVRDPARELASGAFGVLEPTPGALRPVALERLDLVLVPGLAFDRRGHRLGRGEGYFDRLLARLPKSTPTIGVCYDFQRVDRLPNEPHDQAVGAVISA
jgi:5-formyltetrahydrofolate cyclo-ligase